MARRLVFAFLLAASLAACQEDPITPPAPAGAVVWPKPADQDARIRAAGLADLPPGNGRQTVWVMHMDVFKDGQPVTIPGGLGIDFNTGLVAPIHTHLMTGVVSIEGPAELKFTLGQFFQLWGVALTGAVAHVDGRPAPDAAQVVLEDLQQVSVVFGTPPATIPASFPGFQGLGKGDKQ